MGKTTRLFGRCVRSVMKALCRVRDWYVRSLTELSESAQYATAIGCGSFPVMAPSYGFPMEMMSSRDTREISRPCAEAPGSRRAPFSRGVVLETIDEDKPCEFGGDVRVGLGLLPGRPGSFTVMAWGTGRMRRYACALD